MERFWYLCNSPIVFFHPPSQSFSHHIHPLVSAHYMFPSFFLLSIHPPFNLQVRFLEQQNKMLETKWKLLHEQTISHSNIDAMFEAYIANLRKQLDNLGHEKVKLESDLHNVTGLVEDFKTKWVELRFFTLILHSSIRHALFVRDLGVLNCQWYSVSSFPRVVQFGF